MKNLKWALAFLALIVLCIAAILARAKTSEPPKTAKITQNGEVIREVDLGRVGEPYEFKITAPDGGYNVIRVEQGRIAVTEADCPDKICVRRGYAAAGAPPIVCLPHRLSVIIGDNKKDIDAVAGGM